MHPFTQIDERTISQKVSCYKRQKSHNDLIIKHNLIHVKMNDPGNYPYYLDGTRYYRHPKTQKIYRFTCKDIYEALGNAQYRQIDDIKDKSCVPSGMCHSYSLLI